MRIVYKVLLFTQEETAMTRAIALTVYQQQNPFKAALDSAENAVKLVADFMYGTPKRAEYTTYFAIALFSAGMAMSAVSKAVLQSCPV